uniref:Synaptonemal complex protein 1 n=1 Tax=Dicentrarchus labrax TaxID=13489 RepID=E6ZF06_DICLA|nr:Synaptonemal complex protein 1 [Dicentrarchus labrax]
MFFVKYVSLLPIIVKIPQKNTNPGQLYSKLFDEVEKIKCWKVEVDTDTVQKERRLQENKRTIETQRKAIQELQFGNESLSVKLEEQMSENEDLRNKNNATRNLCNILKDTFQRSADKMHLFESEREETHHLFMENSESIQKLTAALESLRFQAEADQQEMHKVKEGLLQFDDLKEKYRQEYNLKEKEVAVLQTKLKDKESELQKILLDIHETQKHCKQLQEATNEQYELLKSSKTEQESLLQELHTAVQRCKETEKIREAVAAMLEQCKEEYAEIIQSKDLNLEELSRVKNQQAEKLEQIQTTVQELQDSLALEIQRTKELEDQLMANSKELERRSTLLGETMEESAKKDGQIKFLEDELCEHQQKEIAEKEKQIKSVETKVIVKQKIDSSVIANYFPATNISLLLYFQNKKLNKQIAKEIAKSSQLEIVINSLHEESENLKRLNEEDHQKLLKDLESKSIFAAELDNEVKKLRTTATEAIKKKEDTELKCQHKIADMVALMEKHKSQYDRMVEEKDAELSENKKKEMEVVAYRKSLELDLLTHKNDNDQLKIQLKTQVTEKENLKKELTDLKKKMSSMKITQLPEVMKKQSPAINCKQGRCSETPKERQIFDFSRTKKTPSYSKDDGRTAVTKKTDIHDEDLKTPRRTTNRVGGTSKIKSYRIRTPPSDPAARWRESAIELDPKSDSSDQNDILSFTGAPAPNISAPRCKLNIFKKKQSPVTNKSPGNLLKLAAMKRMRDAGWAAVTGCDQKKKKTNEKIFA